MAWDLGVQGLALLAAMSLGFAAVAGLLVGGGVARRATTAAVTGLACLATGLVASEVLFGWATEEELQPNVDGLSLDEVLLAHVLTTSLVVLVMRRLSRRSAVRARHQPGHRQPGRHRHA